MENRDDHPAALATTPADTRRISCEQLAAAARIRRYWMERALPAAERPAPEVEAAVVVAAGATADR